MGRAVTWALGALTAAAAGASPPAFSSEANLTVITKGAPSRLYGGTLELPPTGGFGLVTIIDKPPPLPDYRILDLINLAMPWPIERRWRKQKHLRPLSQTFPSEAQTQVQPQVQT